MTHIPRKAYQEFGRLSVEYIRLEQHTTGLLIHLSETKRWWGGWLLFKRHGLNQKLELVKKLVNVHAKEGRLTRKFQEQCNEFLATADKARLSRNDLIHSYFAIEDEDMGVVVPKRTKSGKEFMAVVKPSAELFEPVADELQKAADKAWELWQSLDEEMPREHEPPPEVN